MEHLNKFELSMLFGDIMNSSLLNEKPDVMYDEIIDYIFSTSGRQTIKSFAQYMNITDISAHFENVQMIYNDSMIHYKRLYDSFLKKHSSIKAADRIENYLRGSESYNDFVLNLPIFILPLIRGDVKIIFIIKKIDDAHNHIIFINCGAGLEHHIAQNNDTCYGLLEFNNIDRTAVDNVINIVNWFQTCNTELSVSDMYFAVFTTLSQNFDKYADEIATVKHLVPIVDNNSSLLIGHLMCFMYLSDSRLPTESTLIQSAVKMIRGEKIEKYLDINGIVNGFVLETFLETARSKYNGTDPIDERIKSKLGEKIKLYYEKENVDKQVACLSNTEYDFVSGSVYKMQWPLRDLKMGETLEVLLLNIISFSKKFDSEWIGGEKFTGADNIEKLYTDFKQILGSGIDRLFIKTDSTEYDILYVAVLRLPFLFYRFCKKNGIELNSILEPKLNKEITEMYKMYSKWRIYCSSHPFINIYKYAFVLFIKDLMKQFTDSFKRELMSRDKVTIYKNELNVTNFELFHNGIRRETLKEFIKRYTGMYYVTETVSTSDILRGGKMGNMSSDFIADINTIPIADGILYKDINAIDEMCNQNDIWFNTYNEHEAILENVFNQHTKELTDMRPLIKEINLFVMKMSDFDTQLEVAKTEVQRVMTHEKNNYLNAKFEHTTFEINAQYTINYKYISLYAPKFFAKELTQLDVMLMYMQLIYSCKLETVESLKYKNNALVTDEVDNKTEKILFTVPYVLAKIIPDSFALKPSLRDGKFAFFIDGNFDENLLKTNFGEKINTAFNIVGLTIDNYSYVDALLKFLDTEDSMYIVKYRVAPYMKYGFVNKNEVTKTINYTELTGQHITENSVVKNSSINRRSHTADMFINDDTKAKIIAYLDKVKSKQVIVTKKVYNVLIYLLSYFGNIYANIFDGLKEIFDDKMLYTTTEIDKLTGYDQLVAAFTGFYVCSNLYEMTSKLMYKTNTQKYINKLQSLDITINYLADRTDAETMMFTYVSKNITLYKTVEKREGTDVFLQKEKYKKKDDEVCTEASFIMGKLDTTTKTEKILNLKNMMYLNLMLQIYSRYVKYEPILEYSYDERFGKPVVYVKDKGKSDFTEGYYAADGNMYIASTNFYRDTDITSGIAMSTTAYAGYKHYNISCGKDEKHVCHTVKLLTDISIDGHKYKKSINFKSYYPIVYDRDRVWVKFAKPYFIGNIRLIDDFEWDIIPDKTYRDFNKEKLMGGEEVASIIRKQLYSIYKKARKETRKTVELVELDDGQQGGYTKNKQSKRKTGSSSASSTTPQPPQEDIPDSEKDDVFRWLQTYPVLSETFFRNPLFKYFYKEKYVKGYIGNTSDNRYDFKQLHIENTSMESAELAESAGTTKIVNEHGEEYVRIEDALKTPEMTKIIKRFLNVSDLDNIMIWSKDGVLTKIFLMDHNIKFTYFTDKTMINNDYEIISDSWAINRWLVDCDNMWLVNDKNGRPFIFAIPRIKMTATSEILSKGVNVFPVYMGDPLDKYGNILISINKNSKMPDIADKHDLDVIIKTYKHYNRIDNICELSPVIANINGEPFVYSKFTNRIPLLDREWTSVKINCTYGNVIHRMIDVLGNFIRKYLSNVKVDYNYNVQISKKLKDMSDQPNINYLLMTVYEHALKNKIYIDDTILIFNGSASNRIIDIIEASPVTETTIGQLIDIKRTGEEIIDEDKIIDDRISLMLHVYNTMTIIVGKNNMQTRTTIEMEKPSYVTEAYSKEFTLVDDVKYDKIYADYLFTDRRSYVKPTLLDYYLFSLYDSRIIDGVKLSDYVATYYYKTLEAKYIDGSDEMKADLELIRAKIIGGKLKMNPLELLYQFSYGFFARGQQMNMVNDVVSDLGKKKIQTGGSLKLYRFTKFDPEPVIEPVIVRSRIHNLVMGGGKTSMITPLSILRLIQMESISGKNTHNFYVILPQNLVNPSYTLLRKYLGTYFGLDVQKLVEDRNEHRGYTDSLKNHTAEDPLTHVYVLSDTSVKCGFINDYKLIKDNANKHFYIMDEADTVLNPTVSELNYPIGSPIKIQNLSDFYDVIYDILYTIYRENVLNSELFVILDKYKDDWTLEPHFNVIHGGTGLVREIQQYAKNKIIAYFGRRGDCETIIKIMERESVSDVSERDINVAYAIISFIETCLPTTLVFIDRKNYGLSEKKRDSILGLKEPSKLVVPYGYAESPKDMSQFTDPIIVISLTTVDYLVQIKRMPTNTINKMIEIIRSMYLSIDPMVREQSEIYKEYVRLRLGIAMEDFTSVLQLQEDQIKNLIRSKLFIKLLVEKIIVEELDVDTTQLNVAGVDITMSFNIANRSGFTGTPNIPTFRDLYDDKQIEIRDADPDSIATINTALRSASYLIYDDAPALEYINTVMSANPDKNVLIDIGAILVGVSHRHIYEIRMKIVPTTSQFIFWNDDDKPMSINNIGIEKPWDGAITRDIFYFYNNKHTTGIDAVIPLGSHGMALIGKNRYRDVVQGIFRMRKLTKGHNITFIFNNKIKLYVTRLLKVSEELTPDDLIRWFNIEEERVLSGQIDQMKLQNIRALFKGLPTGVHISDKTEEFIANKIRNPFFVYNTFKYPTVSEAIADMRIVTGEKDFVDIELEHLRSVFSEFSALYDDVAPKKKISSLGEVERMVNTESLEIDMKMELNDQNEMPQSHSVADLTGIFDDEDKLYTFETVREYINSNNDGYHKYVDNVYLSKNMKYYKMPYFVIHCNNNYNLIPVIEGLKILDTLRDGRENFGDYRVVIYDTFGNIYYNNTDKLKSDIDMGSSVVRFICKRFDKTAYMSIRDFAHATFLKDVDIEIVFNILEKISVLDEVFNRYVSCFRTFKERRTEIKDLIRAFNDKIKDGKSCATAKRIVFDGIEDVDIKTSLDCLLKFFTNDYSICYEIKGGGRKIQRLRFTNFPL